MGIGEEDKQVHVGGGEGEMERGEGKILNNSRPTCICSNTIVSTSSLPPRYNVL